MTGPGAARWFVVPSPSWPKSFAPQHATLVSPSSAHECCRPTQTFFTLETPVTCTGLELDIIALLPSWYLSFRPQHQTLPSLSAAQLCAPPPLDSFFTVVESGTLVGIGRSVVVLSP